jgi:hypothetical protein
MNVTRVIKADKTKVIPIIIRKNLRMTKRTYPIALKISNTAFPAGEPPDSAAE